MEKKKRKNRTLSILLTVCVVIGLIVYLAVSSFGESMIYYKTVDELLGDADRLAGRTIRINGVLREGSIRQKPGTDEYRFKISKRGMVVDVDYSGVLPDSMQEGRDLVVQGVYRLENKRFEAAEILTKCPSKHEAKAQAIDQ